MIPTAITALRFALYGEPELIDAQYIYTYYQGQVKRSTIYRIMDKLEKVKAGGKRLVTRESFEAYLKGQATSEPPATPKNPTPRREPPQTEGFHFFHLDD